MFSEGTVSAVLYMIKIETVRFGGPFSLEPIRCERANRFDRMQAAGKAAPSTSLTPPLIVRRHPPSTISRYNYGTSLNSSKQISRYQFNSR